MKEGLCAQREIHRKLLEFQGELSSFERHASLVTDAGYPHFTGEDIKGQRAGGGQAGSQTQKAVLQSPGSQPSGACVGPV